MSDATHEFLCVAEQIAAIEGELSEVPARERG